MKKFPVALAAVMFCFFTLPVFAHGEEMHETTTEEIFHVVRDVDVVIVGSALLLAIIAYSAVFKLRKESEKKGLFIIIIIITISVTAYIAAATIYANMTSETGGPVHWHADFEIWVCGREIVPRSPESTLDNKVGTPEMHHHDDKRIHIEGILRRKSDASLGSFFRAIGGGLASTSIEIDGKIWRNNDLCNGKPAQLMIFVNGIQNFDYGEYIIAPYPNVPPGDRIKIVFDERPPEQLNGNIGSPP